MQKCWWYISKETARMREKNVENFHVGDNILRMQKRDLTPKSLERKKSKENKI